ncbi:hypothetical protein Sgly_1754 [Syntrophobotulus glycolicus DSM 8271]|uniref:Uncharacterized protein n=1 Tax=Syntrophobotulus glycolicus (strain DSM 8271 / FlGlyR) TaxID=645991 RepID=F0SZG5_SYNGF|nr:hypothetical protein Sgly_1754 [Syntrophobotulus glycolicus DSM 8271]
MMSFEAHQFKVIQIFDFWILLQQFFVCRLKQIEI